MATPGSNSESQPETLEIGAVAGASPSGASASGPLDFEEWVKINGGDQEFLDIIRAHGFASTLSVSKFTDVHSFTAY